MENYEIESKDLEDTIVDNEFIDPILKDLEYMSSPKIISFINEYMSLSLNEKIARYLINKKIRNIKNPITNDTLMHYICLNDENIALLKLIKPTIKEIEEKNNLGQALLHIATQNKNYKIVKYLIENGANILSKDNNNDTSLHIAARNSDYNIIRLFMEYNSKINILNNSEETPLDIARNKKDKILIDLLNNIKDKYNTNNSIEIRILNKQRKNEYLNKGYSKDKSNKSNIYNNSVNNCSLDTKNETDSQSFNIYKRKIVSKDKYLGEKKIKSNKTINLNININKNFVTPEKKKSFKITKNFSPITYRTRLVYRKTSPKIISRKDSFNEYDKDSKFSEYESNVNYLSSRVIKKLGFFTNFSIKKKSNNNNIINNNEPYNISEKKIIEKPNIGINLNPKVKIIHYNKLKNYRGNLEKLQNNNYVPISLNDFETNNYKIKKVRNTFIRNTPFESFRKKQKKKEDISKEKLFEFLKEIGMQQYGDILISEGFDDINLIINQMKEGFPISDDLLKEIGISCPGDRAKILIRMQQISGGFNFDFPFEQVFFKNNRSIQKWLYKERLSKYINNFIDAGYQSLELLLIQMASKYKLNDKILKNDIHIYNDEDRKNILDSLEKNSAKYAYELSKNKNIQRTYSKMVQNNSDNYCKLI